MVRVFARGGDGAGMPRGRNASRAAYAFLSLLMVVWLVPGASAQDDFFKPVIEVTVTPRQQKGPPPVFSFARMEPRFRTLCLGLEEDGRRERIVSIATAGVAREKVCVTCRSFWKMVVQACGKLGPRPTPTPKPARKKREKGAQDTPPVIEASADAQSSSSESSDTSEPSEAVATPTAVSPLNGTSGRSQLRYPSTEVLDQASRVSVATYESDNGAGQDAEMFRYFAKTIRENSDLSPPEREYYDVFLTYLLAAWAGRVDATKLPPPTPAHELNSFFE